MGKRNGLHIFLGIIGLAAWMLYILGCRPAWSPDSSKVLFPYCNPERRQVGVALYDRNTGTVRSIFAQSDKPCGRMPLVQWTHDGSSAIVSWGEEREKASKNPKTKKKETVKTDWFHVEILPIGAEGKTRHFKLRDFEPSELTLMLPLVEAGGKLYLARKDEGSFVQLDLKTGHKESRNLGDDREIEFYNRDAEHIVYAREKNRDLEFGGLDQQDLSLHTLFVLRKEALTPYGAEDFSGLLAFELHGSRIAMPAVGDQNHNDLIVICTDKGFQTAVAPDVPAKEYRLGNLEWALDGKTIYATVVTPTEDEDIRQYSLGGIPTDNGPVRLVPIVRASISGDDASLLKTSA